MKLTISNGKEVTAKKTDNRSIVFHVNMEMDEEDLIVSIKGFRYVNRGIMPPSVRFKSGYLQTTHLSKRLVDALYDLVSQQEWAKDILPREEAWMGEFLNNKTMSLGGFTE